MRPQPRFPAPPPQLLVYMNRGGHWQERPYLLGGVGLTFRWGESNRGVIFA